MGLMHGGERMVEWALAEGGAGGIIAVGLGLLLWWPKAVDSSPAAVPGTTVSYHNFWADGSFGDVRTACFIASALLGLLVSAFVVAVFSKRKPKPKT